MDVGYKVQLFGGKRLVKFAIIWLKFVFLLLMMIVISGGNHVEDSVPGTLNVTTNDPLNLYVSWTPIPSDKWNGVPIGYKLMYYQHDSPTALKRIRRKVTKRNRWRRRRRRWVNKAAPTVPRNVRVIKPDKKSVDLTWDKPEKSNGNLRYYYVRYRLSSSSLTKKKTIRYSQYPADTVRYTLTGLEEFKTYYITVSAKTSLEGVESAVVTATTLQDAPGPPQSLTCTEISDQNIELKWKNPSEPNGIIRDYFISVYYNGTQDIAGNYSTNGNHTERFIKGLKPWTSYRIIVRGYTIVMGEETSCTVKTKEGDASPPTEIKATLDRRVITVKWKEPKLRNGILRGYRVVAIASRQYDPSFNITKKRIFVSIGTTTTELNHLEPGTMYTVYVQGVTGKGPGVESRSIVVETPAIAPPQPPSPDAIEVTDTTITILLTPASQKNGQVIAHQLIVKDVSNAKTRGKSQSNYPSDLKSWEKAHEMNLSYYIAAEWSGTLLPSIFVIGDGRHYGSYYNAPLKPDSQYTVQLRAATQDSHGKRLYSNAKRTRLPRTDPKRSTESKNSFKMIAIVCICIALALAVFVITFCVVWYTKRKQKKRKVEMREAQNMNLTTRREPQEVENLMSGDGQENSHHVTEPSMDNYASLNVSSRGGTNHEPGCTASHIYTKLHQAAPPCACGGAQSVNIADDVEVLQTPLYENTQPQRFERISTTSIKYHSYEDVM